MVHDASERRADQDRGAEDLAEVAFRHVADDGTAARRWWDANAAEYLDEHGDFLGPADFVWCPEHLREADARLLGDVAGARVLEVGAGAAQCSRWLATQGALVVASDLSEQMLAAGRGYDEAAGVRVPTVVADARRLPFPDATFDAVFTAFGAIPFVPDAAAVHAEAARVLRPGGRWVCAVTHPVRWAFPDDPEGLTAIRSYFDRRPYVELGASGAVLYAEYHRTLGDHVADIVGAGLVLDRVVEPEWPAGHDRTWGGWGPVRGALLPGTAIFVAHRP
ncbi:class I SAM-dependent methyltransferase [Cellulomonas persica]|uniref:SAM-dependent methyltransferase n=1 Tax=Cellulomonas persica TaxID=76861 RepID=A0A510UQ74_9CELL|nr:class I SAM-dependent methyltransferase [Cellulomonas persica]GEK16823.1 SAM-dependent methyltransferase [Cellulomonas persica]